MKKVFSLLPIVAENCDNYEFLELVQKIRFQDSSEFMLQKR